MRRLLQHPLAWGVGLTAAALAFSVGLSTPSAGQAADNPPALTPPADFKPYTETVPESEAKFDMVPIPGGAYLMGSPASEPGHQADESPQHLVTIRPFWMGKTEVTWDEFDVYRKEEAVEAPEDNDAKVKASADAITGPTKPYADETFGRGREGFPVICVTHHAAMEYCRWLSRKTGKTYRLPTEAEWEYAARAGAKSAYFFGDDPKQLGDYAWYAGNSDDTTHEVGKKKPNPWGLYDMYGNVAEWCLDTYKPDFYGQLPADKPTLEPLVLPTADRFPNVARGGSWADSPARLRSAARRSSDKTWIKRDPQDPQSIWWLTDAEFVGFRIMRPVEELDTLKGLRSKVTTESR